MEIEREPVGPGQESVWDYPRPPRIEPTTVELRIELGGEVVARTTEGYRVLETSHPPTYYLPRAAFVDGALEPVDGATYCEWKGQASYFDVRGGGKVAPRAAWTYPDPKGAAAVLQGYVAVMPAAMDGCFVDGEPARPQEGSFYGGWITSRVVGPFKGGPGTERW